MAWKMAKNGNGYGHAADAGLCTDGGRYAATCEAHGCVVSTDTWGMARHSATNPTEFCDGCRNEDDGRMTMNCHGIDADMQDRIDAANRVRDAVRVIAEAIEEATADPGDPDPAIAAADAAWAHGSDPLAQAILLEAFGPAEA